MKRRGRGARVLEGLGLMPEPRGRAQRNWNLLQNAGIGLLVAAVVALGLVATAGASVNSGDIVPTAAQATGTCHGQRSVQQWPEHQRDHPRQFGLRRFGNTPPSTSSSAQLRMASCPRRQLLVTAIRSRVGPLSPMPTVRSRLVELPGVRAAGLGDALRESGWSGLRQHLGLRVHPLHREQHKVTSPSPTCGLRPSSSLRTALTLAPTRVTGRGQRWRRFQTPPTRRSQRIPRQSRPTA